MWATTVNVNPYLEVCAKAVSSEEIFNKFKGEVAYRGIVTGVSELQGRQYFDKLKKSNSYFLSEEVLQKAKFADSIGSPVKFVYGDIGEISPTTLRYLNVMHELTKEFGKLNNFKVIEIGCGYGEQCQLINQFCEIQDYTVVDEPIVLSLVGKYIGRLGQPIPRMTSCHEVKQLQSEEYDLVISNYAYSELNKDTQDVYFEKFVSRSRRGYMTYNALKNSPDRSKPYDYREFIEMLSQAGYNVKNYNENVTRSECEVIVWSKK